MWNGLFRSKFTFDCILPSRTDILKIRHCWNLFKTTASDIWRNIPNSLLSGQMLMLIYPLIFKKIAVTYPATQPTREVRPIRTRRKVLSGRGGGGLSSLVTLSVKGSIMAATQPPFYQLDALPPFFDKRRSCSILRHYCILTTALMFLRQDLGRVIS